MKITCVIILTAGANIKDFKATCSKTTDVFWKWYKIVMVTDLLQTIYSK